MKLIEENKMYDKLKRGEPVLGVQLRSRSVLIAEMMGYCGMDYVFIEGEHFAYDNQTIEDCIRAVQIGGAVPIVRVPSHEPGKILQVLESGAMGLFIPHVDTPEEAKELVDIVKYYPVGHRGFSDTSRATKFGTIPVKEYQQMANNNVMLIAMIESRQAVENVEGIIAAGVDMVVVGGKDLSEDMGYFGDMTDEVKAAIDKVRQAAKKAGIPFSGNSFASKEDFDWNVQNGGLMFSYTSDMVILQKALNEAVARFNSYKE